MTVKYVHEKKEVWDPFLDCHMFAYNTSKHASSLYSPFEVMFGWKAVLPVDQSLERDGRSLLKDLQHSGSEHVHVSLCLNLCFVCIHCIFACD